MENRTAIITAQEEHLNELVAMVSDLWPDYDPDDLKLSFADILTSDKFNVLLFVIDTELVGFLYLGIRTDYVEGSDFNPTGYVEGIYIKPAFRRKGISRQLLLAGEQWLKEKGCRQIGSDIHLNNTLSYSFHTGMGFKEAARLITFIKDL